MLKRLSRSREGQPDTEGLLGAGNGTEPGVLRSIPSTVMVIDRSGTVRYAAGHLETLGVTDASELVGNRYTDYLDPKDIEEAEALLARTVEMPSGAVLGPVRTTYRDASGVTRRAQVWSSNGTADPAIGGVVVSMTPETTYDHFDHVLSLIASASPLDDMLSALAFALAHEPVSGECYFVVSRGEGRPVTRSPENPAIPGPPLAGPWDVVLGGQGAIEFTDLARLPEEVQSAARAGGLAGVSCFAVKQGTADDPSACLVVWRREGGPMPSHVRRAIEDAMVVASLAVTHRGSGWRDTQYRDSLTGLGNRRSFLLDLAQQIERADQPSVFLVGLEGLDEVNESNGRLVGDTVMRVAARRLASTMRPTDGLARLENDTFAVLCQGSPPPEHLEAIAQRIMGQLSRPITVNDGTVVDLGASIGVAAGYSLDSPASTIIRGAERALATARANGGRQWSIVLGGAREQWTPDAEAAMSAPPSPPAPPVEPAAPAPPRMAPPPPPAVAFGLGVRPRRPGAPERTPPSRPAPAPEPEFDLPEDPLDLLAPSPPAAAPIAPAPSLAERPSIEEAPLVFADPPPPPPSRSGIESASPGPAAVSLAAHPQSGGGLLHIASGPALAAADRHDGSDFFAVPAGGRFSRAAILAIMVVLLVIVGVGLALALA